MKTVEKREFMMATERAFQGVKAGALRRFAIEVTANPAQMDLEIIDLQGQAERFRCLELPSD